LRRSPAFDANFEIPAHGHSIISKFHCCLIDAVRDMDDYLKLILHFRIILAQPVAMRLPTPYSSYDADSDTLQSFNAIARVNTLAADKMPIYTMSATFRNFDFGALRLFVHYIS
jgi:hypothetical protein